MRVAVLGGNGRTGRAIDHSFLARVAELAAGWGVTVTPVADPVSTRRS